MKIVTIIGARPQFIKAAPVSRAIQNHNLKKPDNQINEILVHTGQHYDENMSAIFFRDLNIPEPDVNLGVGSGSHGWQTAQMLIRIEAILKAQKPDWVLVYGDTNSTLAGALAAVKLHIPIAHVEAGLRSFNREMPEEINRVLTDHCADILFCPTQNAVDNLQTEGITNVSSAAHQPTSSSAYQLNSLSAQVLPRTVALVGDTMYDAVLQFSEIARQKSTILEDLKIKPKEYLLATIHRPYNTDIPENLQNILTAFQKINEPIIFPVHPRTRQKLTSLPAHQLKSLILIPPVGYLDMLILEQNAKAILTDSGGMQKEAYFFGVPCVTMRTETEWVETVETGWNVVVGADREKIVNAVRCLKSDNSLPELYGDGRAADKIVDVLSAHSSLPTRRPKKHLMKSEKQT